MNKSIQSVSHYGIVRFGDLECEAVVLVSGQRGYVQHRLAGVLGVHEKKPGDRFRRLLGEFAPQSLITWEIGASPIALPNGRQAWFLPAGILPEIATGVLGAALAGTLNKARVELAPRCQKIIKALAADGEVAFIDAATGYRAPDALQLLQGGRS